MSKVIRGIAIVAAVSFAARFLRATTATTIGRSRAACGGFPPNGGHVADMRRFTEHRSILV